MGYPAVRPDSVYCRFCKWYWYALKGLCVRLAFCSQGSDCRRRRNEGAGSLGIISSRRDGTLQSHFVNMLNAHDKCLCKNVAAMFLCPLLLLFHLLSTEWITQHQVDLGASTSYQLILCFLSFCVIGSIYVVLYVIASAFKNSFVFTQYFLESFFGLGSTFPTISESSWTDFADHHKLINEDTHNWQFKHMKPHDRSSFPQKSCHTLAAYNLVWLQLIGIGNLYA